MALMQQTAKHFKDVHFGGNWTSVNLKDSLEGIEWQQAVKKVYNLNSIADLVFHINYYVSAIIKVLEGGPLDAHDKFSFDTPPIQSQADWNHLREKALNDAEKLSSLMEQLPDNKLEEDFDIGKYGNYFRNLHGLIEHTHYHLGQISLLKKIHGFTPTTP